MSTATTTFNETEANEPITSPSHTPKPRVNKAALVIVLLVVVGAVIAWYSLAARSEETDDAQVDGHLVPITARVEGTIQSVSADDNQPVKAGDLLVQLDPKDNQVALDQVKANTTRPRHSSTLRIPTFP